MIMTPDFVNEYFEAQGLFDIQFNLAKQIGIEVRIILWILQGSGSKEIMNSLAAFFQQPETYVRPLPLRKTLIYETQDRKHHQDVVCVHFNKHPLKSMKQKDFKKFERALSLTEDKRLLTTEEDPLLTKDELRELIELSYVMNAQPNTNSPTKKPKDYWLKRIDSLES